jgi:hypothetical protein
MQTLFLIIQCRLISRKIMCCIQRSRQLLFQILCTKDADFFFSPNAEYHIGTQFVAGRFVVQLKCRCSIAIIVSREWRDPWAGALPKWQGVDDFPCTFITKSWCLGNIIKKAKEVRTNRKTVGVSTPNKMAFSFPGRPFSWQTAICWA